MTVPPLLPMPPDPTAVRRVALLSVHTSPLDQPGAGDGGGLNVYVREVARRLGARGVEVDVFTRATDPDLPASMPLPGSDGATVHHVVAGPVRPLPKQQLANHLCAFVLAAQRHPAAGSHDVIHGHYWLSGWVGRRLAGRWRTPLVQTFHTLGVLKNATLAPGDRPEPALRLVAEARVANDADRILVLTCAEARLLHRAYGLSGARLTVVPAGVDLDLFTPAPTGTPRRPGPPRLLFVGRLQPLKGPHVAVQIFAEVRRRLPDAELEVIGGVSGNGGGVTGPDQLRALAEELGVADGLRLRPPVDQPTLARRYRDADVVLVPSRSETFGLVALEAQACGTPVVAADVPGLEVVVAGGGTLVDGHEPRRHAEAVLRYLLDPAETARAAAAGVATARASSWDRTVDRLLGVYAEVAQTADPIAQVG